MNKSHILKTAIIAGALDAVALLFYGLLSQLTAAVIFGILLGYGTSMFCCYLLYKAGHDKKHWAVLYISRLVIMVATAVLAVFVPFFDPIATVIALTTTMPALTYVVNRWKNG